ncbi:hypothetical protein PHLCEN_2v11584 [Hermanssonia centrifuga]|uniref:Uncharacterized protein n=1 Tax=Hermanssonia centrifuga TaxID=98765 RepID=A0A2R6NJV9_9APHY|nr:hypothetical protein PHLCEN_2v11584 [Hermanssonia centrifuga]
MSDILNDPSTGKIRAVEKLEVEDEEKRQQRMHDMFMQLDGKLQTQARETPRTFDFGDRTTFLVEPPIELLSRVQAFLPQFAASNAEIALRAKDDPESVDIEKLGNESSYIQMNLGLGVFEERKTAAGSSASDSDAEMHDSETSAPSSFSDSSLRSDSETSEDSGCESDDSIDIISCTVSSLASRPIRPLPRRKSTRPHIVILGEANSTATKTDSSSPSGESQE